METRPQTSDWWTERKPYVRNEKEVYSFDFEGAASLHPISNKSSFMSNLFDSSKENVELSLEVEIADSLKHLIVSPEKQDSALLDVTIVRPTDLNSVPGLENSNRISFKSSDVRNLIASMERQKQLKKKLIDQCNEASSLTNPHLINSAQLITNQEVNHLNNIHRLKRPEKLRSQRGDIAVSSAPTKCVKNLDNGLKSVRNIKNIKQAQLTMLKPLVGEVKQSLKNLEATIDKAGDRNLEIVGSKKRKQEEVSTPDCNISNIFLKDKTLLAEAIKKDHTQIYAAPNTYDKLRTLFACQNPDRDDGNSKEPCLCQHCGMIGLLIESQKRPIVPMTIEPPKRPESTWPKREPGHNMCENESRKNYLKHRYDNKHKQFEDFKGRVTNESFSSVIHELSYKLQALEDRISLQEKHTVSKDYLKRIIGKLWTRSNLDEPRFIMESDRNVHFKDHSTQYNTDSIANILKSKNYGKVVRHRNVQIQQNTKKSCCVNPVLIVQGSSEKVPFAEVHEEASIGEDTKPINAIHDYFIKRSNHDGHKNNINNAPKKKISPIGAFWKWGEEIIKPGLDLKTKIISLLDEQLKNRKMQCVLDENELLTSGKSTKSVLLEHTEIQRHSSLTYHFLEKDITKEQEQSKNEDKFDLPKSSNNTLKKMFDMMTERIYNEHVKPTVEAVKEEQKCLSSENTKQVDNIKAAMDAALSKITTKESQPSHLSDKKSSLHQIDSTDWPKDFLEPLEVPSGLKKGVDNNNSKLIKQSRKSGIPVRISAMSPTDSTFLSPSKDMSNIKSLIPRYKSPVKDTRRCNELYENNSCIKEERATNKNRSYKIDTREDLLKRSFFKKPEKAIKKNSKSVHVKYLNPKAEYWNEESGASLQMDSSEEAKQILLTDDSSKSQDNNGIEIRRISQKYSVTDKLGFLINVTKQEMGKAHIWNSILKEAKNYCKSMQDTVVIQIPTHHHNYKNKGLTEVEFTVEDIQKLMDTSKVINPKESGNMDSFLLIHSKKILEEVHKKLNKQMLKNKTKATFSKNVVSCNNN